MMGYSGGAIATTWASALQPSYAPELHVAGVAAGGIPANPGASLGKVDGTPFAGAIIGVSIAIDRAYPELNLRSLLNDKGRALADRDAADGFGCAGSITSAPFGRISQYTGYRDAASLLSVPRVRNVMARLDLVAGPTPTAPSFFYNTVLDELAIIKPVDDLVAANCAHGATIQYHRELIGEHNTGAVTYLAPALHYLADRFAGKPAPNTCR
jgi:hypothetical protein